MKIQESGEMYLETILVLSQQKSFVRAVDVCEALNYSKPSVSRGLHILEDNNYITIQKDGALKLTESGHELAVKIYDRHIALTNALISLGIDEITATEDACRIEHVISDKTMEAIKAHLAKVNK